MRTCNGDFQISSSEGIFLGLELSNGRFAKEEEVREELVQDIRYYLLLKKSPLAEPVCHSSSKEDK